MRVDVEMVLGTEIATVRYLLLDVSVIGEFGPERRRAVWTEQAGPRVGARFEDTNSTGETGWNVSGEVPRADRSFAWVVHDDELCTDRPSLRVAL